jgi:hypothetical protein
MFDFFKSKKRRASERLSSEILASCAKVANGLDSQIDLIIFFGRKSKADILSDLYVPRYIYGMFDAVTMQWGLQIRSSLGEDILRMGFTEYMKAEFGIDELYSSRLLANIYKQVTINPTITAVIHGGTDGQQLLRGDVPERLVEHFGCLPPDDIALTPSQMAELLAFRQRKDRSKGP